MDHIVAEAVEHYHEERPHQSKENELLVQQSNDAGKENEPDEPKLRLQCKERLGGLLKHYYLRAA